MCAVSDQTMLLTNLWKAVVQQALEDYRWEPVEMINKPLWRSKMNAKKTAEWWLGTEDFYQVCHYASLKADDVLKQFKMGESND